MMKLKTANGVLLLVMALSLVLVGSGCRSSLAPLPGPSPLPDEHPHAQRLLDNALHYLNSEHGLIDPASGYPVEGWNNDPARGLYLRSFTQLTAIGEWIELLANIAEGSVESEYLSRDQAFEMLAVAVASLLMDQRNPDLSDRGLLVNFLGLTEKGRQGPLASQVDKRMFVDEFGEVQADAIWRALQDKGWIARQDKETDVNIIRGDDYGLSGFNGPLAPFADEETSQRIMAVLDHRVVQVVFGDNANLSASVAKVIGALLNSEDTRAHALIEQFESFLEAQREGYAALFDPASGLCFFGWNATKHRTIGWVGGAGEWVNGHSDYLVNEFRGPTLFVVLRFDLPVAAYANLGFKIKPYQARNGRVYYTLAPWSGSAFQALGLSLFMGELDNPAWRVLLDNFITAELDYARQHRLSGFLSESYTGNGTQYSGEVGVPALAVTDAPRITNCPSLYTLGIAYRIAPDKVEDFLADNWRQISTLFTDHGPWEGYDVTTRAPITFQTSAHTLSLILGLLGTGSEYMTRYLAWKEIDPRALRAPSVSMNLLAPDVRQYAWCAQDNALEVVAAEGSFRLHGAAVSRVNIALVPPGTNGVNFSNGELTLRYRSREPIGRAVVEFKPVIPVPPNSGIISKAIFTHLDATGGQARVIRVTLPPTPGLEHVKELVISFAEQDEPRPMDMTIEEATFTPLPAREL